MNKEEIEKTLKTTIEASQWSEELLDFQLTREQILLTVRHWYLNGMSDIFENEHCIEIDEFVEDELMIIHEAKQN